MAQLDPADWGTRPEGVVTLRFIGGDGRSKDKDIAIYRADGATLSQFMDSTATFASDIAATFQAATLANVDYSFKFQPSGGSNSDLGEYGDDQADINEMVGLTVFLDTNKKANINWCAPVDGLFMGTTGPARNVVDVNDALLDDILAAYAGQPNPALLFSAASLSDGERIDASLGYDGLERGHRYWLKGRG